SGPGRRLPPQRQQPLPVRSGRPESLVFRQAVAQGLRDLVIAIGRQAQPPTDQPDRVFAPLEPAPPRWCRDVLALDVEPPLAKSLLGDIGGRFGWTLEVVEPEPQVAHPRQWMRGRDLDHPAPASVLLPGSHAGLEP